MRLLLVGIVFVLAGCGSQAAATVKPTATARPAATVQSQFALHGLVTGLCSAMDLNNVGGTQVTIRNQANVLIGVATASSASRDGYLQGIQKPDFKQCKVTFNTTVPRATMYQMKIGSTNAPVYSFAQLRQRHWHVDLTINP